MSHIKNWGHTRILKPFKAPTFSRTFHLCYFEQQTVLLPSLQLIFPLVGTFLSTTASMFVTEDLEWILTMIAYDPTYAYDIFM